MAPVSQPATMAPSLLRRYYCSSYGYGYSYGYNDCYSPWDSYGRWILLACIVVGVFLIFLAFSCITARRRRRQGRNPYPLTGWAGGPPPYQAQHPQHPNQYGQQQGVHAPPVYSPPKQGYYDPNNPAPTNTYGHGTASNQGYFGGQQSGIELQAPGQSYQPTGGEPVYAAPQGPPPAKHDGIVR